MTDIDVTALRLLAFGLLQDRIKAADAAARLDARQAMVVTQRQPVALPVDEGQRLIGSVTLASGSTYAAVSNEAALLEWVRANHPDAIRTVITETIAPWLRDEILSLAKKRGVAVDERGEVIPGVTVREGDPTVKVVRDKSPEAQAMLVEALFQNNAAGLRSLLAIEPATTEATE